MRGEHLRGAQAGDLGRGSSPHARGAPSTRATAATVRGIIPACAGSTFEISQNRGEIRDHPRMRGEHEGAMMLERLDMGSSPHARGAHDVVTVAESTVGIIPACAGSTHSRRTPMPSTRDHPRMRGEHSPSSDRSSADVGSSPHARGAPTKTRSTTSCRGIIPACAGSTCCRGRYGTPRGDHPRMRGEHYKRLDAQGHRMGSSPHARGARRRCQDTKRGDGIIPACAGSTLENQPQSLVYAYDSLTFAHMQFYHRIAESRKSRSVFRRTASPCGTCSHRSTPSKGDPQGQRHRFRWAAV